MYLESTSPVLTGSGRLEAHVEQMAVLLLILPAF